MIEANQQYVNWFRHSAPYINAHRGRTFVIYLPGEALAHSNFAHTIHDINLLNSLGEKLVLVLGSRPQIEKSCDKANTQAKFHNGLRITDLAQLALVQATVGRQAMQLEARFSMGIANSPMHGSRIRTSRGNFITARPIGVKNGVDFAYTGEVRRVDSHAISKQLDDGNLVLISCLGYSPTGETFNLAAAQVAGRVAASLQADKLIVFGKDRGITNSRGETVAELLTRAGHRLVHQHQSSGNSWTDLSMNIDVLSRACDEGVARGHLLSYEENGALLSELFSRDGSGTMVIKESYEQVRNANIDDVGGILQLIRPLEDEGVLVRRSRELLESEIHYFSVIERDNAIIGCAALYPFDDARQGELACMAIDADYRGGNRGQILLKHMEQQSSHMGLQTLFVLTTASSHWFIENGFVAGDIADLPTRRQSLYNFQRNSKVFSKELR